MTQSFVTRFAPSPTGRLHLGHAFSAVMAFDAARGAGGRFILRIEDIDAGRCREVFVKAICEDLAWLGLAWEHPVRRQSACLSDYERALARLDQLGVIYPCICTRKEIAAEIARSASAPHGPEGPLYPGTCRRAGRRTVAAAVAAGRPYALRLDLERALTRLAERGQWPLLVSEQGSPDVLARPEQLGDVVLARKDVRTSYHLAVTVDDALQGITHVIRGQDLAYATGIHRVLQALLDLPAPNYRHHRLITDGSGRRLAKRDRAATLEALRESGESPAGIRARLGLAETSSARPEASRQDI